MAKKKKPAANPARGFATTSIASKPKPEIDDDKSTTTKTPQPSKNGDTHAPAVTQDDSAVKSTKLKERELHELTPEELTAQLEHNELQMLVETLGPKVRREVSRLESKLRTDGRVIRSQAQDVSLRKWLPEELMIEVLDAIKKDRNEALRAPMPASARSTSEDDLVLKCWTLWEALLDFGVQLEHVKYAVATVIERLPADDGGSYVWGFRDAIDLLAIDLEEAELPSYDARKSRATITAASSHDNSVVHTPAESVPATPESSPG